MKVGSSDWCTRRSSLPVRCTGRGAQWMGNSDWADWPIIRVVKPKWFSISGSHFGTRRLVQKLKNDAIGKPQRREDSFIPDLQHHILDLTFDCSTWKERVSIGSCIPAQ